MQTTAIPKNHMDIPWHEYSGHGNCPITEADLTEKASIVGRVGLMLLSCGTGAWRVRSSMNTISQNLGITCSTDIGLMSIEYTCFDGTSGFSQSLCLTNTGVNTSKLNRLERFIGEFSTVGKTMTGEQLHDHLDEIDRIHGLYSPVALGFAAALACGAFTFLLGGGPVEMLFAFCGAGLGNFVRCKLTKHHLTLFLGIVASVASACVTYTILLRIAELIAGVSLQHEAGYICSMLFIIPGFPFITSGIDLAKLDMRSGPSNLKITDIRVANIDGAPKHCPLIKVYTNQGLIGYGEVRDASSDTYVLMLKSRLVGENPCNVDKLFNRIRQFGGHSRQGGGVSGIEIALWDLVGKAYGVPMYQLLGGKYRDKVRVYCDTDVDGKHTGTDMGRALKKRMEAGFTFLKMDLGIEMLLEEKGCLNAPVTGMVWNLQY